MVGIGCLSLWIALFALRMSTQIRISPSGFGTTTRGDVHSVGLHGTSSLMTTWSISSNFLSTLSGNSTCQWITVRSHSQYIHFLCCVFSKQSFSRTLNNSELTQTAFGRNFTVNFSFKCSQYFNWFSLTIGE